MLIEPLDPAAAEALAAKILTAGTVRSLTHFAQQAEARGIRYAEAVEAIETGRVVHVEKRKGTWRYRFENKNTATAVLFAGEDEMWLVTTYDPRNPETGARLRE